MPAKMDVQFSEILAVFLHPVIQRLDVLLFQKTEDVFFQLPGAFAGNDFDEWRVLVHRLLKNGEKRVVDVAPLVVNVMKIKREFHGKTPGLECNRVTADEIICKLHQELQSKIAKIFIETRRRDVFSGGGEQQ